MKKEFLIIACVGLMGCGRQTVSNNTPIAVASITPNLTIGTTPAKGALDGTYLYKNTTCNSVTNGLTTTLRYSAYYTLVISNASVKVMDRVPSCGTMLVETATYDFEYNLTNSGLMKTTSGVAYSSGCVANTSTSNGPSVDLNYLINGLPPGWDGATPSPIAGTVLGFQPYSNCDGNGTNAIDNFVMQ